MSVLYVADLHFGHRLVAGHRGFSTVEAHDTALVENWCRVVHPEDHIWVLGDIAVSSPTHALSLLASLPGIKHLVWGNHDKGHPMHRDAWKSHQHYLEVFRSVQMAARRRILGKNVLLSHFPYHTDRGEVRYPQWRLRDEGEWLLHGHTHSSQRRTSLIEIHVGLDAWDLTPVTQAQIEKEMNEGDLIH